MGLVTGSTGKDKAGYLAESCIFPLHTVSYNKINKKSRNLVLLFWLQNPGLTNWNGTGQDGIQFEMERDKTGPWSCPTQWNGINPVKRPRCRRFCNPYQPLCNRQNTNSNRQNTNIDWVRLHQCAKLTMYVIGGKSGDVDRWPTIIYQSGY